MKKIIIPLISSILFGSAVIAANPQNVGQNGNQNASATEKVQGQQVQTEIKQQTQNSGEEQQNALGQQKARTMTEVREMVQQKKQEMIQEMQGLNNVQQKVYQNQNKVREAVQALLSLEDLAPGIGPQVSQIAREFNNSVQATIIDEEKIQKRNAFVRFFIGGEKNAANNMEQELNQNQQRIQELKQLREDCACGEDVKSIMREQIQNMEQEQERLRQLTDKEKNAKGLFGWVRNLFNFVK